MTFWEDVKGLYYDLAVGAVLVLGIYVLALVIAGVLGAIIYVLVT